MFVIISKKKWKALMAERDRLSHDVAKLYAQAASLQACNNHGHRVLADNAKELRRRVEIVEKELKRKHHGNTLAGKI